MPKIAVGIPWSSPFMFTDWFDGNMNMKTPDGCEMRWFRGRGWCPARRHIDICEQAMAWGADLITIVGADQMHPEDMICRLYDRVQQGYEVVAAMIPARGFLNWQNMKPFQPMAWRFKPNAPGDLRMKVYQGASVTPDLVEVVVPGKEEMERVNFIGSGVIMFHADHLRAMQKPWFVETVNPENMQRMANMDCKFVWRLQHEADATVWVDTTIKPQHLTVMKIDESYQNRFDDWINPGGGDPSLCMYRGWDVPESAKEEAVTA